jgi:hypothetical protein
MYVRLITKKEKKMEVTYKGCLIIKRENRVGKELYYAYRIDGYYVDAKLVFLGQGESLKGAQKWVDIKCKEVA